MTKRPDSLEILSDETLGAPGFLTLRRLRVRHVYSDGSASPEYNCDVSSRRSTDAVGVVLWFREKGGQVMVVLKEGVRPPIWLRRTKELIQDGPGAPLLMIELVAGILEPSDKGEGGLQRRAAAESREEAGVDLPESSFSPLGSATFPSPGASDECVFLMEAELNGAPPKDGSLTKGDGSPMEHGTQVLVMEMNEALARCRDGGIPNMLAELGLGRLKEKLDAEGELQTRG